MNSNGRLWSHLVFYFHQSDKEDDQEVLRGLEKINDECRKFNIDFVKVDDPTQAVVYGLDHLPGLMYFENKIPSVYDDGPLTDTDSVLSWIIDRKMTDSIEEVTDEILKVLSEEEPYLGVYWSGPCDKGDIDDECNSILGRLEKIDSKVQEHGIMLVTTEEREYARQNEVRNFPALGLFRNGEYLAYEGDFEDEYAVLEWLTDKSNLLTDGRIEVVNRKMLEKLITVEDEILVFLCRAGNLGDQGVLDKLEKIDQDLDDRGIEFVTVTEKGLEKKLGFGFMPVLVFYHDQIPIVYRGNPQEVDEVLKWLLATMEKSEIEEVTGPILDSLVNRLPSIAVVFYRSDHTKSNLQILTLKVSVSF